MKLFQTQKETINADVTEKTDTSTVEIIYSINDSTKEAYYHNNRSGV